MDSQDVRALQAALNKLMNSGLAVDGIYGPATKFAVKDFQAISGIAVDGVVGRDTSAALDKALGARGFGILEWIGNLFKKG